MSIIRTKVLYVITKSNFGGAQRYLYDLASGLPQDRYDVTVALGGTGEAGAQAGALKNKLLAQGVRVVPIKHFMRDMSLYRDVRAFFELMHIIRTLRPDVLHVMSAKAGGLGVLAGRLALVRVIIFTSHGLSFDESWRPRWQRVLIRLVTWTTMVLATRTIQISRDTFERARSMPLLRQKVVLVHNGIDTPDFVTREEARRVLLPNAPESVLRSVWIGTIAEYHPNKNLDLLIEALALLKLHSDNVHLLLVGDGEERHTLERLAETCAVTDRVHFVGYLPEASRYLPAFDIFTLPSRKEGLPYVLLESGLAGLPVVVTDITGNTEIITHQKTGLVVDARPESIATALQTLIDDPAYATSLGAAHRKHVEKSFSRVRMLEHTKSYYHAYQTRELFNH